MIDFYGRFLVTNNASTMPTTAIATIMPMIPGSMYVSAIDWIGNGAGVGVVGAAVTANDVSALDGQ